MFIGVGGQYIKNCSENYKGTLTYSQVYSTCTGHEFKWTVKNTEYNNALTVYSINGGTYAVFVLNSTEMSKATVNAGGMITSVAANVPLFIIKN